MRSYLSSLRALLVFSPAGQVGRTCADFCAESGLRCEAGASATGTESCGISLKDKDGCNADLSEMADAVCRCALASSCPFWSWAEHGKQCVEPGAGWDRYIAGKLNAEPLTAPSPPTPGTPARTIGASASYTAAQTRAAAQVHLWQYVIVRLGYIWYYHWVVLFS